ncbi:Tms1p SKDI_04G3310 [Saccharomyces kudriavzevii IFO 1802]|uniref:Uncharacterized protein n=2 Tax=Saccharomyces kudriavzevii (strain ATCC MYA-4449 / AS 2.2408 / CBS 8840 / NBRC 1802 / NCYC 2889) TaxID=226230 RepID=A0AA35JDL2_SACK1|nr:uncharacterized protein SKDI_04G3310 [Saccharomyces kudriavzevii IFO 1802]EJT42126.1 TMS1-like protein [Saccharomyces kudriavzevii IFO 1802]CAI4058149.1 hypothetical protein SKDI_04G3310 [Saccharomyces kudriavzevii IFO 1802]
MGAVISLPVSMAGSFVASCFGGCCSGLVSKTASSLGSSSLGTRLLYAFWLLINSLISWISYSANKSILWPGKTCTGTGECGFFTVHRLNFALGCLHLILASVLMGVKSTNDVRAAFQNSWWSLKFILYLCLIVLSFVIPNDFYIFFSKWVSVPSGAIFILVGLILLVDFAHEWAETCISHVESEDEDSSFWQRFLVLGTTSMYTASIIMTVVMYVMFCHQQCNMNQTAVTVNLILTVITLILSVNPKIQEANPKSGLAQSSMVSVYCTYLTMSAMSSEPDDKMCNPLVRSSGTRKFSIILGSLFTFVAIAYTTTRAAANSAFQGTNTNGAIYLGNDIEYEGLGGQTRNQLRYEAIKQAVEEGSLPESALYDTAWLGTPSSTEGTIDNQNDDERTGTKYNYTLFHIIFFLATQWIAILLTINVTQDDVGDFIPVGRTYFYSWVKIVSAWICYALYGWTIVAPAVMPDRFGYENYY